MAMSDERHLRPTLRCFVLVTLPHRRGRYGEFMDDAWGKALRWIEYHSGTTLRWAQPAYVGVRVSWGHFREEALRADGNVPEEMFRLLDVGSLPIEEGDAVTFVVPGAGNYAGSFQAQPPEKPFSFAVVGEATFGPLARHYGYTDEDNSSRFFPSFEGIHEPNTAFGTLIHETLHNFGDELLSHADHFYDPPNVMKDHRGVDLNDASASGLVARHRREVRESAFVQELKDSERSAWQLNRWWQFMRSFYVKQRPEG